MSTTTKKAKIETVQHWLNLIVKPTPPLAITGKRDKPTAGALKAFQLAAGLKVTGTLTADTWRAFGERVGTIVGAVDRLRLLPTSIVDLMMGRPAAAMRYDRSEFFAEYMAKFGGLSQDQMAGLDQLLRFIEQDPDVTDHRWVAYFIVTAKVETANTYRPIREFHCDDEKGGPKWYAKPHACPAGVKHHKTGAKLTTVTACPAARKVHCYFGRGYVQITHAANYQKLGTELGYGDAFLHRPERVMEPEIAYKIMSHGIRKGSFTGKSIDDYIKPPVGGKPGATDYLNARRVINGITAENRPHVVGMAKAMDKLDDILVDSLL
jgi:hypothetical protein